MDRASNCVQCTLATLSVRLWKGLEIVDLSGLLALSLSLSDETQTGMTGQKVAERKKKKKKRERGRGKEESSSRKVVRIGKERWLVFPAEFGVHPASSSSL